MKKGILPVFIMLIALAGSPSLVTGESIRGFEGGSEKVVVSFLQQGDSGTVNLTIPAESYIINASLVLCGMPATGDPDAYPMGPSLSLNGTPLWEFNGSGYGALGRQDTFLDGKHKEFMFPQAGGSRSATLRMPKTAEIRCATVAMDCSGPLKWLEIVNYTPPIPEAFFGNSISRGGDVNGDGFDDLLVGELEGMTQGNFVEPWRSYLYFGGDEIDRMPDANFTGVPGYNETDWVVSGGDDLNGDGFDDILLLPSCEDHNSSRHRLGTPYIYLGGQTINSTPDAILNTTGMRYGSASLLGDFNGDGYGDMIAGAPSNSTTGTNSGTALVYLGGPGLDTGPDLILENGSENDSFAFDVDSAGDVNGDGYDDAIVTWCDIRNTQGAVYIYLGGAKPDAVPDIVISNGYGDWGDEVAGCGDINGDGYDDVAVLAWVDRLVRIYFGGESMDTVEDLRISDSAESVSGAGDVNGDGYDDLVIGGPGPNWNNAHAYIYYGGPDMDNITDAAFIDETPPMSSFGCAVSSAGDMDGDNRMEVAVGAYLDSSGGGWGGKVFLYGLEPTDITDPEIKIGSESAWIRKGGLHCKQLDVNLTDCLADYLINAAVSGCDAFGNRYVDVPIKALAKSEGSISFHDLNITYVYNVSVMDFSDELSNFLKANKDKNGADGNISVPLSLRSESPGRIALFALNITLDLAPRLRVAIPDAFMDEDSANSTLIDLFWYFEDDYDSAQNLSYQILDATNTSLVTVAINGGRYISADSLTGSANDNWTGEVRMKVSATDIRGLKGESNEFRIIVRNVNDPPLIISAPPTSAQTGTLLTYTVIAIDGDGDVLEFSLARKPDGMSIDASSGQISWIPSNPGNYDVALSVSDGQLATFQNFTINVAQSNRSPKFITIPVMDATIGIEYIYVAGATDEDGDTLSYSLAIPIEGMTIDSTTGIITWTPGPGQKGYQSVVIRALDGKGGEALQDFVVKVVDNITPSPVKPVCSITHPSPGAKISGKVNITGRATNGTYSVVQVRFSIDGREWLNATGTENWTYELDTTRLMNGKHTLKAKAFDGNLFSDPASVDFFVYNQKNDAKVEGPPILAIIIAILMGATVAAIYIYVRRKNV